MNQFLGLRSLAATAVVTGSLLLGGVRSAPACDPPRCYWKTITEYVDVEREVVSWETRYDQNGKPYRVKVTAYKTVTVPVQKRIRVCY